MWTTFLFVPRPVWKFFWKRVVVSHFKQPLLHCYSVRVSFITVILFSIWLNRSWTQILYQLIPLEIKNLINYPLVNINVSIGISVKRRKGSDLEAFAILILIITEIWKAEGWVITAHSMINFWNNYLSCLYWKSKSISAIKNGLMLSVKARFREF